MGNARTVCYTTRGAACEHRGLFMNVRRRWSLVVLAVLLGAQAAMAGQCKSAKEAIETGKACLDKRDYDKAVAAFTEAINFNPRYALPYSERSRAYMGKGDIKRADSDFHVFLRLHEMNSPDWLWGIRYRSIGNRDAGIAVLTEVVRCDPALAKAYCFRGRMLKEKGDYDKAIADFAEAIRLEPLEDNSYLERGLIYSAKGDPDKAIADASEAIRLNPRAIDAFYLRGSSYAIKRDNDKAISDLTEAIRLDPRYAEAYRDRGATYLEQKDFDKAIADCSRAIRLDPMDWFAYGNRAYARCAKGDFDNSLADAIESIQLNPNGAEAYGIFGFASLSKGDTELAIAGFSKCIELNPRHYGTYTYRGRAYAAKGDFNKAVADFTEAIRLNPKNADAYRGRAEAYYKKRDRSKADTDVAQAIRFADPANPTALRVWRSGDGKQVVRGEAVDAKYDRASKTTLVYLKTPDGATLTIPFQKLDSDSREFAWYNVQKRRAGEKVRPCALSLPGTVKFADRLSSVDGSRVPETAVRKGDNVLLGIAPQIHALGRPPEGWCGEVAIQEALLYYGLYYPQEQINEAGSPAQPDLHSHDILKALRMLGIEYQQWPVGPSDPGDFLRWVRRQIAAGLPVLVGVKIYPTQHPEWSLDHFVLAVGVEGESLVLNTTWGFRYICTERQLRSTEEGFSFANKHNSFYGISIKGPRVPEGARPVRLFIEKETADRLQVIVKCEDLEPGAEYRLYRLSAADEKDPKPAIAFKAKQFAYALYDTIPRGAPTIYRCRKVLASN
jgi:tetratricopeptide (TPR) repeat protein